MDWLKLFDDAKATIGAGGLAGFGALIMKWRADRRNGLEHLVNELQEECQRKGIENERLNKLVSRLDRVSKHQRLEIFFHNRLKAEAKQELILAIDKVKENAADALFYIGRAVSRLEEDVVVPVDGEGEAES